MDIYVDFRDPDHCKTFDENIVGSNSQFYKDKLIEELVYDDDNGNIICYNKLIFNETLGEYVLTFDTLNVCYNEKIMREQKHIDSLYKKKVVESTSNASMPYFFNNSKMEVIAPVNNDMRFTITTTRTIEEIPSVEELNKNLEKISKNIELLTKDCTIDSLLKQEETPINYIYINMNDENHKKLIFNLGPGLRAFYSETVTELIYQPSKDRIIAEIIGGRVITLDDSITLENFQKITPITVYCNNLK